MNLMEQYVDEEEKEKYLQTRRTISHSVPSDHIPNMHIVFALKDFIETLEEVYQSYKDKTDLSIGFLTDDDAVECVIEYTEPQTIEEWRKAREFKRLAQLRKNQLDWGRYQNLKEQFKDGPPEGIETQ